MTTIPTPTFTTTINQSFFIEPLNGTRPPGNFLDRFPDAIYNKSPDSRLVKFMYALLGPSGVAATKQNLVQARLLIESQGIQLFNLEQFYSDPFSFGRLLDEIYDVDPTGLIAHDDWARIRASDEQYRARALAFFNGAQLGTTPTGLALVAQSGLGHAVEVIENYRYLFDSHSVEPLNVPYMGQTYELREFIVIPRQHISQTSVQTLKFELPYNAGNYLLSYQGKYTSPINWNDPPATIQARLQSLSTIGTGNVEVTGTYIGPVLDTVTITFTGALANTPVQDITVISGLVDTQTDVVLRDRSITVGQIEEGVDPTTEVVEIRDRDRHALQTALDYTRPVTSISTVYPGTGLREIQNWRTVTSSSDAASVVRTVTGNPTINWPIDNPQFWIRQSIEVEAPRKYTDRLHHYAGFHKVKRAHAYTDAAVEDPQYLFSTDILSKYVSERPGRFPPDICRWIPFFIDFNASIGNGDDVVLTVDNVFCPNSDLPIIRGQVGDEQLIDGIYPTSYVDLPDVDAPSESNDKRRFWASHDRTIGAEYLELDLGQVRPVNYISFDITRKPVDIEIDFDVLDQAPRRNWHPVTPNPLHPYPSGVYYESDTFSCGPWKPNEYHFGDPTGAPIFTRFIRIRFIRRTLPPQHFDILDFIRFMFDEIRGIPLPWSIDVRNLRVGRTISL